jgi:hypothetical protein
MVKRSSDVIHSKQLSVTAVAGCSHRGSTGTDGEWFMQTLTDVGERDT